MKKMNKMGHHQLSSAGLRHTRARVRTKASQRVLANAVSEPEKMNIHRLKGLCFWAEWQTCPRDNRPLTLIRVPDKGKVPSFGRLTRGLHCGPPESVFEKLVSILTEFIVISVSTLTVFTFLSHRPIAT